MNDFTVNMAGGKYELRQVVDACDWASYHRIRRTVLFEARGRFGVYEENHPDERSDANRPLLLLFQGIPVCAVRLDRMSDGSGIVRLMAVEQSVQRRGHGSAAISLSSSWPRADRCALLKSTQPQMLSCSTSGLVLSLSMPIGKLLSYGSNCEHDFKMRLRVNLERHYMISVIRGER